MFYVVKVFWGDATVCQESMDSLLDRPLRPGYHVRASGTARGRGPDEGAMSRGQRPG